MSGLPLPLRLADSPIKGFGICSFHPVGKIESSPCIKEGQVKPPYLPDPPVPPGEKVDVLM